MILGLDVSTSCVGWGVVNGDETLVDHGYISLKKFDNMLDKANELRSKLESICKSYKIDKVGIEDYLQKIAYGKSSANTICVLAGFNSVTQYICQEVFKSKPIMVKFSEARKKLGIKQEKGEKAKECAFKYIVQEYSTFKVELNRNDKIRDESKDSSDGVVIAKSLCR